jgi:hypothetical protein
VILNKAMSLVVVAPALPFRASTVPFSAIAANWPIVVNLLAESLLGAWSVGLHMLMSGHPARAAGLRSCRTTLAAFPACGLRAGSLFHATVLPIIGSLS